MYNLHAERVQEVAVRQTYLGQQVVNILHFEPTQAGGNWPDAPAVPTSQDLLAYVATNLWSPIVARQVDGLEVVKFEVKEIDGYNGSAVNPSPHYSATDEFVPAVPTFGSIAGAGLPSYAAVTVRKLTALPGRRWRGSCRIAGIPEADSNAADGNRLTAAAHAAWINAVSTWHSDFRPVLAQANNFMAMAVLSLKQMSNDVPIAPFFPLLTRVWAENITGTPVNVYLGSQVSRKVGHGS